MNRKDCCMFHILTVPKEQSTFCESLNSTGISLDFFLMWMILVHIDASLFIENITTIYWDTVDLYSYWDTVDLYSSHGIESKMWRTKIMLSYIISFFTFLVSSKKQSPKILLKLFTPWRTYMYKPWMNYDLSSVIWTRTRRWDTYYVAISLIKAAWQESARKRFHEPFLLYIFRVKQDSSWALIGRWNALDGEKVNDRTTRNSHSFKWALGVLKFFNLNLSASEMISMYPSICFSWMIGNKSISCEPYMYIEFIYTFFSGNGSHLTVNFYFFHVFFLICR